MAISRESSIKGYEILECIGEGAYGAVYRARQPFVDRVVAIKVILPEYANQPNFIRRFETEAQLVAKLEHLHIVPLYDYWRDPDGAYLVMRLMKGGSLADALLDGPLELTSSVKMVDQVTSALTTAHQQGVVHRDIKPANILLDEEGNAYLSDFGIAKAVGVEAGLTATGVILGTPAYISPEQVQSLPLSPQTDIYALGVVLYEMLTGQHPFPDTPTGSLILKQVNEPLPLAHDKRPDLPVEIDQVIQRATAKEPSSRYSDALSLVTDLRRALKLDVTLPEILEGELYNPYKGLRAFQEADAGDFFGREALISEIIHRLEEDVEFSRFLAVVGPSGSGKSSVVKAGLMPAVRQGAIPGSERWFITEMVPGAHPLEELELSLLRIAVKEPPSLLGQLKEDNRGLLRAVRRVLPIGSELLLVVDQLEEAFTLVENPEETAFFLQSLYEAVCDPKSPLRLVVTLRADFYDRPLMYPDFSTLIQKRTEVVVPLTSEELQQAIGIPAERVGVVMDKGLVPTIIGDVLDQPGALPLLQYTLTELFERREGRLLTCSAYQSIGGVLGALGRRAEEVYSDLDVGGQNTTRQLFLRLVTLGEEGEDTRRRVLRAEVEALNSDSLADVIGAYDRARLLSFDRDPISRGPTIEVAHEALLKEWARLHNWLDESRGDVRMQRILNNAAAEWLASDRDTGFLLRGSRLVQFEGWVDRSSIALTENERSFLEASLDARHERENAEQMRRQRELEQVSIGLASQAIQELDGPSPERSVMLALEALENYPYTWQAERALGKAVLENRLRSILKHDTDVNTAEWSADGSRILTGAADGIVRVWDSISGDEILRITEGEPEYTSWSPDEKYILAINESHGVIKIWDEESGLEIATLGIEDPESMIGINPNCWEPWSPSGDRILITSSNDGTARVWDAQTGEAILTLSGHQGSLGQALWSPAGDLIVTSGYDDGMVIVWQADSGEALYSFPGEFESESVIVGGWSPSGDRFTIRGMGGAKVYHAASGRQLLGFSTPQSWVFRVIWSPDGDYLLTSGKEDGTARLWNAETGEELDRITGLVQVYGSDWSPSGNLVAVSGADGVVHVWEVDSGREILKLSSTMNWAWGVKFSPDGNKLFAMGDDKTVSLFDLSAALLTIPVSTHGNVSNVAWSPTGDRFAFGLCDPKINAVKIWDSFNGDELLELFGQNGIPNEIAWSPGGDRIAIVRDKLWGAKILDASTGEELLTFSGPEKAVLGIYFGIDWSPDGKQIAIAGDDNGVILWDSTTGEVNLSFSGHEDIVRCVAWSPCGTLLLSTSNNGEAKIWEAATGQVLFELLPEEFAYEVTYAAWAKDGRSVFLISTDDILRIYNSETGKKIAQFTTPPASLVSDFSLSPTEERMLIGGHDGRATVLDTVNGAELLSYDVGGFVRVSYSPDGKRVLIGTTEGTYGTLQVFPTWQSTQELIDYAKEHKVFRQLTDEERGLFGLPPC